MLCRKVTKYKVQIYSKAHSSTIKKFTDFATSNLHVTKYRVKIDLVIQTTTKTGFAFIFCKDFNRSKTPFQRPCQLPQLSPKYSPVSSLHLHSDLNTLISRYCLANTCKALLPTPFPTSPECINHYEVK